MKNDIKRNLKTTPLGYAGIGSAKNIETTQWTKYHSSQAHGFTAEDFNALCDRLCGHSVDKIGLNNELNGADRIVNGVKVQTKYCRSAYDSVSSAFDTNGNYRYLEMKLEVPRGQGKEAIRIMEEKIKSGKVPGVSDPVFAKDIVIEGKCTYDQAVRIAKAGNIDSIKFDVMNQMVTCTYVVGLSFIIGYVFTRIVGGSKEDAIRTAVSQAVKNGVTTMTVSVAIEQFLRTQAGRNAAASLTNVAKKGVDVFYGTSMGKPIIEKMMTSILGKATAESAARNACIKLARTNIITTTGITIATIAPDIVKGCTGKKSWKQVSKNSLVNFAGIGLGSAGWWAGAAAGTAIFPGVGTIIGGLAGALGGGFVGSIGTKKGLDYIIKDDAELCSNYVNDALVSLCEEYGTSKEVLEEILQIMKKDRIFRESFFEKMFKKGGHEHCANKMRAYAIEHFRPYFKESCIK